MIGNDVVENMAMTLDILDDVPLDRVRELAELLGQHGPEVWAYLGDEEITDQERALVAMMIVIAPAYGLSPVALVNDAFRALGE